MPPIIDGLESRSRHVRRNAAAQNVLVGHSISTKQRSRLEASETARRRLRWHLRFGPIACGTPVSLIRRRRVGGWA